MKDRTREVIILVFGLVLEALIFIKDKLKGDKERDNTESGQTK